MWRAVCVVAIVMLATTGTVSAAAGNVVSVTIDARAASEPVTRYEYGMFIEPIGGLIARTLWAEMLDDRKFYYPIVAAGQGPPVPSSVEGRPGVVYRKWRPIGADGVQMDSRDCYVGSHCPRVVLDGGSVHGFGQSGIGVAKGKAYRGHVVLQGDPGASVAITLIWGSGTDDRRQLALPALSSGWQSYPLDFVSGADCADARLEITGSGSGAFRVGTVSLMPADNIDGWRADTTSILQKLHSGMWRLPGGNFLSNWDWHGAIGPRDRRAPMFDHAWSAMQPNDLGMDEYMELTRILGVDPYLRCLDPGRDAHCGGFECHGCGIRAVWRAFWRWDCSCEGGRRLRATATPVPGGLCSSPGPCRQPDLSSRCHCRVDS